MQVGYFSVILGLVYLCRVKGYPDGAPAEACLSLTPLHGDHQAMSQRSNPFALSIMQFKLASRDCYYYEPGMEYNITLSSPSNAKFKGFFIQARLITNGDRTVGEFSDPEIGRFHSCTPPYAGVTHNLMTHHDHSHDEDEVHGWYSATFQWKAPEEGTGSLAFRFTVVEEFDEFWVNAETQTISEGECVADASVKAAASVFLILCALLFYFLI